MEPFTTLRDRKLWFDGTTEVEPDAAAAWLSRLELDQLAVARETDEIRRFNQLSDVKLKPKVAGKLPAPALDPVIDAIDTAAELERIISTETSEKKINRLLEEYALFQRHGLDGLLKQIIYVLRVLKERKILWGVGRGSSCSLYLLYRLGLHSVDPLRYDIPYTEFFKKEK